MSYTLVKFGGSNFKNIKSFQSVFQAIDKYSEKTVFVVSAIFGLTERLIKLLENKNLEPYVIESFIDCLRKEYGLILEHFIDKQDLDNEINLLTNRLKGLRDLLLGISYIGNVPMSTKAIVLSYGERLSSFLIAAILHKKGYSVKEILPEEMGLYTDGEYLNAGILLEESKDSVRTAFQGADYFLVPGFYGVSQEGEVNLLGRGGSDYSAAAIAYCLEADSLDLWKDVDGFLSADPKLVPNPCIIPRLNYQEAAELAYFGAGILHPACVEPLVQAAIPIQIFNINQISPDDGERDEIFIPKTRITDINQELPDVIKSVSFTEDVAVLVLRGTGVGFKPGILAKVCQKLESNSINIKSVITSQIAIDILLSDSDIDRAYKVVESLELKTLAQIERKQNVSLIALVGNGIFNNYGIAARIFSCLANHKINVELISFGASRAAIYFLVDNASLKDSVRLIHQEFFTHYEHENVKPLPVFEKKVHS